MDMQQTTTTETLEPPVTVTITPSLPAGEYAKVEMMGHRTVWGRVSEVERFGVKMCQVEPICGGQLLAPIVTTGASIYCLTPVPAQMAFDKAPKDPGWGNETLRLLAPPAAAAGTMRFGPTHYHGEDDEDDDDREYSERPDQDEEIIKKDRHEALTNLAQAAWWLVNRIGSDAHAHVHWLSVERELKSLEQHYPDLELDATTVYSVVDTAPKPIAPPSGTDHKADNGELPPPPAPAHRVLDIDYDSYDDWRAALSSNYVAPSILPQFETQLRNWFEQKKTPREAIAELDGEIPF